MLQIILTILAIIWLFGIYPAYYTVGLLATIPRRRAAIALFWPPVLLVYAGIMLWVAVRPKPEPVTLYNFLGPDDWARYRANGGTGLRASTPRSSPNAILNGFIWVDAPEGALYWQKLHKKWRALS